MSRFITFLTVTEVDDSVFAVANTPFVYESDIFQGRITVPVGFYTDFASVPRFMPLAYACLGDTAHQPAVIHDWLYYSALTNRATADRILLEAMDVWGMPLWRREAIYWGVRAGGWAAWNAHRKKGNPQAGKFA